MPKNVLCIGLFQIFFLILPRYSDVRVTYQAKLEQRLPLMAIVLPEQLLTKRPEIKSALQLNRGVLTTPHDIYATVLDAIDMQEHWNTYKVKGAQLTRGLTLFKTVRFYSYIYWLGFARCLHEVKNTLPTSVPTIRL